MNITTVLGKMKIKGKIVFFSFVTFLLSILFIMVVFSFINQYYIEKEVGKLAMQTVDAVDSNLDLIFHNVAQCSDLIFYDSNVQSALRSVTSENINPAVQKTIQTSLSNMLLSGNYIDSVFIIDQFDNSYSAYKVGPISIDIPALKSAGWYNTVNAMEGEILYLKQGGGVISYRMESEKEFISLIRTVTDINNYQKLATLIINVDVKTIQAHFRSFGDRYNSTFCIINSNEEYMVKPASGSEEIAPYLFQEIGAYPGYKTVRIQNNNVIIAKKPLRIADWSIALMLPIQKDSDSMELYRMMYAWVIVLNLVFLLTYSGSLSKLIFNPLHKFQTHIMAVEDGEFVEIPLDATKTDEITSLQKMFNKMVVAIRNLIEQVKAEEKAVLQNELDLIQAQINPHFLYNTLDAVSALALTNDTENCLKITQSLGNFYKNSLNSGKSLVTIADEIKCIQSYVDILNIRYDNKIFLHFDIEQGLLEQYILKLILQPIVENAVHHGLRSKQGDGTIEIKAYRDEDEIIFIITDDGVGMTMEKVEEIRLGKTKKDGHGFGLYSSIQRGALFYNIENPITITSEIGSGTEITIRTKVLED